MQPATCNLREVEGRAGFEPSIDEVAASNRAFAAAIRTRDIGATADAYTSDARLVAPSSDLFEGRTAIAEFWRVGVEAGVADATFLAVALERGDSVAYELGDYTLRVQPFDGEAVFDRGRYVVIHRREPDGKWRRAVEMLSPNAARGR